MWQKPDSRTDGRTDGLLCIYLPHRCIVYSTCAFDLFFYIGLKTTATDDAYPYLVILARSFTAHVSQTRFFNTSLMISSVVLYLVFFLYPRRVDSDSLIFVLVLILVLVPPSRLAINIPYPPPPIFFLSHRITLVDLLLLFTFCKPHGQRIDNKENFALPSSNPISPLPSVACDAPMDRGIVDRRLAR